MACFLIKNKACNAIFFVIVFFILKINLQTHFFCDSVKTAKSKKSKKSKNSANRNLEKTSNRDLIDL